MKPKPPPPQLGLFAGAHVPPVGRWRVVCWPIVQEWHSQALGMAEDDPHRQYYKRKNSKAFAFRLTMEFATPVDGYDTVERGWMGGDEEFGQFGHLWFVMTGHNPPLPNVTPEREDMQRAWELFAGRYQRVTGQANWMVRSTDFIDTVWGGAFLDPGEPAADAIVSEWAPLSLRKPVGAS